MTDLAALLKPDQGQPATALHLVDKKGFEAWLKAQPARVRQAVEAQGFKGEGYPARHPARRARRLVGRARRRQCRGAQPLVPRQGGGEPARGHLSRRRPRARARRCSAGCSASIGSTATRRSRRPRARASC